MRKHWIRLWRKTLVLRHPIAFCHVTHHLKTERFQKNNNNNHANFLSSFSRLFPSLSLALSVCKPSMASDLEIKAKEAYIDDHFELAAELYF